MSKFVFFLLFSVSVFGDFQKGFSVDADKSTLKKIYLQYGTLPEYLLEYETGRYYSLSPTGRAVGSYNLNKPGNAMEGWKLKRWPHLQVPAEINFAPGMTRNENISLHLNNPSTGCMTQSPLRYGDLEQDGDKEIVLILDDELVVFSPKYEGTVFSMFIDASDWWPYGEDFLIEAYSGDRDGKTPNQSDLYHGYSHSWSDRAYNGQFEPGVRAYSKLFTGDFDDDGNPDIIKWEKVYRSNKKTASIAWNKVRNTLTHYERDIDAQKATKEGVTGEYLPQITTDIVIESWLRDKKLSWQQGYPSKSECEGMEGKLIPEMHDPLLNDPDVLQ